MRFTKLFTKTSKSVSEETESINARWLTRAGFIRQEIAGVYSFLPLGWRVLQKIEAIVRTEMDQVACEGLFPTLASIEPWQATGRLDSMDILFKASGANQASRTKNDTEYIVGPSHEEIVTPLAKSFRASYKDFPFAIYQIQTKFRNEARAKSGLLRGREFRMKDMYSFHASQADLTKFYDSMKSVYLKTFAKLGLADDTYLCLAGGGDFTDNYTHEFQTILPAGEDTIYLDRTNRMAYNQEVLDDGGAAKLGVRLADLEETRGSEVGNIFPLDTKYSKAFDYAYTNEDNQRQLVWMGCYGIGTSRLMGVMAEKFADEKGLVWPTAVAPFRFHLVVLGGDEASKQADQLYTDLAGDVLYDDRADVSAGQKFADADLIGCPIRLVISDKTSQRQIVEVTSRAGLFDGYELALAGATSQLIKKAA